MEDAVMLVMKIAMDRRTLHEPLRGMPVNTGIQMAWSPCCASVLLRDLWLMKAFWYVSDFLNISGLTTSFACVCWHGIDCEGLEGFHSKQVDDC
ncbi:MAG: hypothetical protein CMM01_11385 [Rhodopirellula sp.]|nr:hypothetical protein [Rhodopirellula sp.]OUX51160.1 MAG: hypothetical protein CBE43_04190 [Rhodopirellula sp. TMED283]